MSDYIDITRLGAGTLSAQTILNTSSYLVTEFPLFADSHPSVGWKAFVDGGLNTGTTIQSLQGIGGLYGKISFQLTFAYMSTLQAEYLFTTILDSRHINAVTVVARHQLYGNVVINCYMTMPPDFAQSSTQQTDFPSWSNMSFPCNRGVIAPNSNEYSYEYSTEYS